jgi:DNA modification methylase
MATALTQAEFWPETSPYVDYDIILGDAAQALDTVADESCQLVVTSPPYNIGKEYERDRRLPLRQYVEWVDEIIGKLCKKVSETGSICWQVGNFVDKGEIFPLDLYFYKAFKRRGLKLRNRIIWQFNFGLNAQNRFSGRYETLLWFTKTDNYKFNLDPVRVRQIYPGKRHSAKKGERAGLPSGNPKGKNPSDFWVFHTKEAFLGDGVWEFPNVKANHLERTLHPCQFPSELAERCILALSEERDVVLDPFVGAGTTAIAALRHGRSTIGIDRDPKYVDLTRERIEEFLAGELKLRPLGRQTRTPVAGEKVATLPEEWLPGDGNGKDKEA